MTRPPSFKSRRSTVLLRSALALMREAALFTDEPLSSNLRARLLRCTRRLDDLAGLSEGAIPNYGALAGLEEGWRDLPHHLPGLMRELEVAHGHYEKVRLTMHRELIRLGATSEEVPPPANRGA